jgi:uncharacterized protein
MTTKANILNKRYNSLNEWLRARFNGRVFKISLESGLSCPNRDGSKDKSGCIFCNMDSLRPTSALDSGIERLDVQIEKGLHYIENRHGKGKLIAHFGNGSNTYAPAEQLAKMINEAISHPAIVGLAISTRPDCITKDHLKLFDELNRKTLLWLELGLQSSNDETLKLIRRGHTAAQFSDTCAQLKKLGIMTCAHVILGLPHETSEMMIESARFLNRHGAWGVKLHNLHVLKGTELEKMHAHGEIILPDLSTYAKWVVDFLEELSPEIVVHRVNSHSPRRLTVAPEWSINKLAIFNAVDAEFKRRDTWQGKKYSS